jgi:hypothetical protein
MQEEWRPVPFSEFAEHYEVSNKGQVRRLTKTRGTYPGKILTRGNPKKKGIYPKVVLNNNYHTLEIKVYRLVALTFIGPPPTPKHEVAHWDGEPTNCAVDNLRWATRKENKDDQRRHGTLGHKLTQELAEQIRAAEGSQTKIGKRFGICQQTVSQIKRHINWPSQPTVRTVQKSDDKSGRVTYS